MSNETIESIEESLWRWGRYLTSTDYNSLLLSMLSAVIPEIIWAFMWQRRHQGVYVLKYSLPGSERAPEEKLSKLLRQHTAATMRQTGTLRIDDLEPIEFQIEPILESHRAERRAARGFLVPTENLDLVAEIYVDEGDSDCSEAVSCEELKDLIDRFLSVRKRRLEELDGDYYLQVEGVGISERQLFEVIYHDIKAWLGRSLGEAHLFLYDASDRMLYHRATGRLELLRQHVKRYEAVPQASNQELLQFVERKILQAKRLNQEQKSELCLLLNRLRDSDYIRKNAFEMEKNLRVLLTLLPQEPGTGVAGHTALTRVPEMTNRRLEALWDTETYPTKWFGFMLSVEKLFGIATTGSMAAVPLIESGQITGVLFVTRLERFKRSLDTLVLLEKAAQASPLLTLYRTQSFHHALVSSAISQPSRSIGDIAAEHSVLAFNPVLVAHWQIAERRIECVTLWGFRKRYDTFHRLQTYETNSGMWRPAQIKTIIHKWSRERFVGIVERPNEERQMEWGLPNAFLSDYSDQIRESVRSAIVVVPPLSEDVILLYMEEDGYILRRNWPQIQEKLTALSAVEILRSVPRKPPPLLIGETEAFLEVKRLAQLAASARSVLIYGQVGTGKSRLANYIYYMSGRQGEFEILDVSHDQLDS